MKPGSRYSLVYEMVKRIPPGRVATYGQIASLCGFAGHARQVGYALSDLPDGLRVPWHRVINARGEVSRRAEPGADDEQRRLLENEGVRFNDEDRISLERYGWRPRRTGVELRPPASRR